MSPLCRFTLVAEGEWLVCNGNGTSSVSVREVEKMEAFPKMSGRK